MVLIHCAVTKYAVHFSLLIILMFAGAKALCSSNCTIFVDPFTNCENTPCGGDSSCDFIYSNLPHALVDLDMLCAGDLVTIHLMKGDHLIAQYAYGIKVSKDIIIQGQNNNTTISCRSVGDDQNITSLLLFYNSTTVELNDLEFNACQRPIRFNNISKLTMSRCAFRNFSNGAVDVLDVKSFVMSNSEFLNISTPDDNGNIRSDSGGLVLRYSQNNISNFHAYISDCCFINGTAGRRIDPEELLAILANALNVALNQNQFSGRGGGMNVYINTINSFVTVIVRNCLFENNFAEFFGGGLYIYTGGRSSNHSVLVEDTDFINNSVAAAGGAVHMGLLIQNLDAPGSQFNYTRCSFLSNSADYGGGISAVQTYVLGRGNIVNVKECNFEDNFSTSKGSAITFASLLYPESEEEPYSYSITNCNFTNNSDPGGIVNLGFNNAEFYGINWFEDNDGPSLRIVGSMIKTFGNMVFRNNDARAGNAINTGAAVYISEFGQLQVTDGTTIEFSKNKGGIGAGIFVDLETSPVPFSKLVLNYQCFMLHSDLNLSPNDWKNVNVSFTENVAKIGAAVFATSLDMCSWQEGGTFDTSAVVKSPSFNYGLNTNTGVYKSFSNNTDVKYYVQTYASKVTINGSAQQNVSARPGQNFRLYVQPVDEFDLVTFATLRLSDVKDNSRPQSFNPSIVTSDTQRDPTAVDLIHMDPSLFPFIPSDGYINLTFGLPNFPTQFVDPSIIQSTEVLIETPFNTKNVEIARFNLTVLPCQAGFALRMQSNGLVQCDCSYEDTFWLGSQIISCNKETESIILVDGYWSIAVKRERWHLQNYQCPIAYCMCLKSVDEQNCFNYFNHSDPYAQCHPSRTGILCGSCVNNAGVGVLSEICLKNCHSYAGAISITLLVLWNGLLAILLLCLSLKFPPELKGILFYIQIVPYVTEYFPISAWRHKQYMLYISSFLSFYFPVDFCLFPSVDALTVYAVGYIPLVVITATQLITVTLLYTFKRSRRYLRKSAAYNGMWTWIFLVYSRYIYNSINLLNCPTIGNEGIRWFRDGTVKCFQTPGHLFLALLAILVLTIGLALIPLIILVVYDKIKIQGASCTLYLYKPLTSGYKNSAKWWAAFDLFRRFIIILVVSIVPGRTSIPAGVVLLIFLMHVYFQPYQMRWHNWLETFILLHLVIMLILRSTPWLVGELTDYNGIMVPLTEEELNSGDNIAVWPDSDGATVFFQIWIYLPLLFGMLFLSYRLAAYVIPKIKACFKRFKAPATKSIDDSVALHHYFEMEEKPNEVTYTISYA